MFICGLKIAKQTGLYALNLLSVFFVQLFVPLWLVFLGFSEKVFAKITLTPYLCTPKNGMAA